MNSISKNAAIRKFLIAQRKANGNFITKYMECHGSRGFEI